MVLSLQWLRWLLRREFDPWPGNFHSHGQGMAKQCLKLPPPTPDTGSVLFKCQKFTIKESD